jgi:inosine/xanthosine triphosphate pyrophosphatase family protein
MRIIFATHNKNKITEVRQILGEVASDIVAKSELGIDFEPVETGKTFADNAELKASGIRSYMLAHGMLKDDDIIMSDDSGL